MVEFRYMSERVLNQVLSVCRGVLNISRHFRHVKQKYLSCLAGLPTSKLQLLNIFLGIDECLFLESFT